MVVKLPYGKKYLTLNIPDNLHLQILRSKYVEGLSDEKQAVSAALKNPIGLPALSKIVRQTDRVGIIFSDITRATPYRRILPPLLDDLKKVPNDQVVLFCATGTHRLNTEEELVGILGREVVNRFKIIQNNAQDRESHVFLGTTSLGTPVSILESFLECDIGIATGFIEPHFFAGFSGGGKAIMPGLASIETILSNHSVKNIDDPRAVWGITEGNPIWEDIMESAEICEREFRAPLFLLNVALNSDKSITGVFAGDLREAHRRGCAFVKDVSMCSVEEPFDIVITSNSGYPLDLNLYQTVKGMSAAAQIVKEGGSIIIASSCWDGIPEHGEYGRLLKESESPDELLNRIREPGFVSLDSWQAQIHATICQKADVYLYSDNLSDEQITGSFLKVSRSIEKTLVDLLEHYGRNASVCVLPEGPMSIPYVLK